MATTPKRSSTLLNRFLITEAQRTERRFADVQQGVINRGAKKPLPDVFADNEQEQYFKKLATFMSFIEQGRTSANPYNNNAVRLRLISTPEIVHEWWESYEKFFSVYGFNMCPQRQHIGFVEELVQTQLALIIVGCQPVNKDPIMLDGAGRILDGVQRLGALDILQNKPFLTVRVAWRCEFRKGRRFEPV